MKKITDKRKAAEVTAPPVGEIDLSDSDTGAARQDEADFFPARQVCGGRHSN